MHTVNPDDTPQPQTRRRVLRWGLITAGLAVLGSQLWLLLKLALAPKPPGGFGGEMTLGPVDTFAPGSVTHLWKARVLLVHQPGGFLALSQQCTHNKCNVDFLPERGVIFCPCHSSQFDLNGNVLAGPAPRPLDRFATTIRDGQVLVDTSVALTSNPKPKS